MADIKQGQFGLGSNLFKKILYVGMLDALSKTVSYSGQGSRDRFVSLILHFANWKHGGKISLPHLVRLLQKVHSPEFSELRAYAHEEFDKWPAGQLVELNNDLDFNKVKKKWPSNIPKPLEDIRIESIQHLHLLYFYRSSLVHELRQPGRGVEIRTEGEPYYYIQENLHTEESSWELIYPIGFYERMCDTVIGNLRAYYLKDRIDPYRCFTFGTYWIDELNR